MVRKRQNIFSRRTFHKTVIWGSFVAGAYIVGFDPFSWSSDDNKWGFLEREIDLPKLSLEDIMHNFVPLHGEQPINSQTSEYRQLRAEMEPKIIEGLEKGELGNISNNYKIELTRQRYGVPDEPEFAQQLLEYCRTAEQFLYDRLPQLKRFTIDWTPIKDGDDYSKEEDSHEKGLIGKALYDVIRYRGVNSDTKKQDFMMVKLEGFIQSFLNIPSTNGGFLKYWNVFIGSGPDAIPAPFSEVLPLSIFRQLYDSRKTMGVDGSKEAIETVSEGISHLLSLEIVKELDIPNGRKMVEDSTNNLSCPKYKYVPNAIRWMQKNGMEVALDLYTESPQKFMDAIKS